MGEAGAVSEPAPAKLNLLLRVLGRREDGYHDLRSLIVPLTLADGVQVRRSERLVLTVVGECAADVPRREENLVVRAARALAEAVGIEPAASLLLSKRIPVAAGLGGGSADAAATLRALARLWGVEADPARLREIGARIGSDVPALVEVRPALVGGRGEVVEPAEVPRTWWVLLSQTYGVRAGDAYRWLDEEEGPGGTDPEALLAAITAGELERAGPLLSNDLEAPVAARHPEVGAARDRLLEAGALGAVMVGSGPTVAGLVRDGFQAEEVAASTGGIATSSITRAPA
ncbi:MAG: 4-(cytidine 5'-diphospho)-2-C-methyl-D-erythritol kinase [Actinomycetota bacterium]